MTDKENFSTDTQQVHPEDKRKTYKSSGKRRSRRLWLRILIAVLAVLLLLAIGTKILFERMAEKGKQQLISGMTATQQDIAYGENADDSVGVISRNGKKYKYNDKLVNFLFMGIDNKEGRLESKEMYGQGGQADSIMLVIFDSETGQVKLLSISRDSMTPIRHYSSFDNSYLGTEVNHLALAYAMGDGGAMSCELAMEAVSNLLYGVPIQKYGALSIQKIQTINDSFGGVTVTIPNDDLSGKPHYWKKGDQITLKGSNAFDFIHNRDIKIDGSNNGRMERQKTYLNAFYKTAVEQVKANPSLVLSLLNSLDGYYLTNLEASEIAYLAQQAGNIHFSAANDCYSVPGENNYEEAFDEFYVDDKALYDLILELFYKEIQ